MGLKFELKVMRSVFLDANIFDPPPTAFLTESEMVSLLKILKYRNKGIYQKIKDNVWDKIDSRLVPDIEERDE